MKKNRVKEVILSIIIGAVIWSIFGYINSQIWKSITHTSGYYQGILPGSIIGGLIGFITGIWGLEVGILAGAIIGVLGNFFNVATLAKPLPVDIKTSFGEIRAPLFVAIPGGIFGTLSSWLIELIKSLFSPEEGENFQK